MAEQGRCRMCHLLKELKPLPVSGSRDPVVCAGCFRTMDQTVGFFESMGLTVVSSQLERMIPGMTSDSLNGDNGDAPDSPESNKRRKART